MQMIWRHLTQLTITIAFLIKGSLVAQQEPIFIPSEFNLSSRVTKSSPSWLIRVHQANEPLENSFAERESVLAGTRLDSLGFPLENFAKDANPIAVDWIRGHTFSLDNPMNLNAGQSPAGVPTGESTIPGIPGFEDNTEFITTEIRILLEIPLAGVYRFGIHASGGLKVVTGNIHDVFDSFELVSFEGTREAEDARFDLEFERNGLYQFRVLWFTSSETPSFEWWQLDEDDNPVLLNSQGGLKVYADEPEPLTSITRITPADEEEGVLLDQDTIHLEIQLGDGGIDQETIVASVNEQPANHTVATNGSDMTIDVELPALSPFTEYVWTLNMEAGRTLRELSGRFTTTVFGDQGTMFIEAEDFDFGKGNWDQLNPTGMTGPYPGGTYRNRGDGHEAMEVDGATDLGIDYFADPSSNDDPSFGYRAGTGVTINALSTRAEDVYRGEFSVISNHVVADQHEGEWLNYTRDFPTSEDGSKTDYNVFVRAASGEESIGLSLSRVISGHNTSEQETELLAELKSPTMSGDQDAFHILPLMTVGENGSESRASVSLGGTETLRITSLEGSKQDIDYLLFLPSTSGQSDKEPGSIVGFSREGDQVIIEYTGRLLSSETVNGAYSPVENAASPYTITPDQAQAFFVAE